MFKQAVLSIMGLAAAVTLPAVFFTLSDHWKNLKGSGSTTTAASSATPGGAPAAGANAAIALALEGAAVQDLAEILRFDATPQWIAGRWPRVTTGLAELQLQGYRVPLVTGTAEHDLAGALSYYFDSHQQLRRITFSGSTGDPRNLVAVVVSRYKLTRRLTNDPGLIVYEAVRSNNQPASALRIRSAPVIEASKPYQRFDVKLVLERPEEAE